MLGVNNRNLGTFDTSVKNSFRLLEQIKREIGVGKDAARHVSTPLLVSESGISDVQTIRELRSAGFRGFLIGEMFMKTPHPGTTLNELVQQIV
jgi:indole-3-glycerol phosphate synthase